MSVLVKGMKLPESCGACKLSAQVSMSLGAVMRCRLLGVVGTSSSDPYDVLNKRHPNCPLVALPDKHGRLVDADAFKADYGMKDDCADCEKEMRGKVKACEYDRIYSKMDFCSWLDVADVVIEAEDSE